VLREWVPGRSVRLARADTYWDRERVRLAEAVLYPIENPAVGEAAYRAGQLHVTGLPLDKVRAYRADPALAPRVGEGALLQTAFFRLNCTRPPLNDPRVRRALSLAIDREQLARRVVQCEQPARSFTPPNCAGYTAEPALRIDVVEAQRLLAEAGFPGGRGFPALEVPFYIFYGPEQAVLEAVQAMWREHLGIAVSLVKQEMKTVLSLRRTGRFDLISSSWVGDYLDASTFLDLLRSGVANNATGWASAEYDRVLEAASRTTAEAPRHDLLRRAEALMLSEAPIIPLYHQPSRRLHHAAVRGWHENLLDLHPLKAVWLEARP
jgi:oligopeptide transport system substrate-binding protein